MSIGCEFRFNFMPENLFIQRFHGQGMMNKAFGECAFTWLLEANGMKGRRRRSNWYGGEGSRNPMIVLPGEEIEGWRLESREVGSHLPLTWILRHKPAEWDVGHSDGYGLMIDASGIPDHWARGY